MQNYKHESKKWQSSQVLLYLPNAIKILRALGSSDPLSHRKHTPCSVNSCSGKSKTYFCFLFANVPPSYSSCWEVREVALVQTSKFRYVSACQHSCVLNMEICNTSCIAQSYTLFFLLKTKKGQAPRASAHKFIVLALGNLAGNSCSLNANLQSEHLARKAYTQQLPW